MDTMTTPDITTIQSLSSIKGPSAQKDPNKAVQAAQDFEAVFISEMMKPMFQSIGVDDVFGGGKGEEVFRGMMVQEYGKLIAKQGGVGVADQVRNELLKIQEHNHTGETA